MTNRETAHQGDPCIHCGAPHDEVEPGPCPSVTQDEGVNKARLAQAMLDWHRARIDLDLLEAEIEGLVLRLGETVVVGYTRASYSGGRKTYDYEGACLDALSKADTVELVNEVIKRYTTTIPAQDKTDWKKVCREAGLKATVSKQTAPSVTIKIEK